MFPWDLILCYIHFITDQVLMHIDFINASRLVDIKLSFYFNAYI
jgi:hypothetical protein